MNLKFIFFHFYFLNIDTSFTIYTIDLKLSVLLCDVFKQGNVSQIFDLGPSFYFMQKNG